MSLHLNQGNGKRHGQPANPLTRTRFRVAPSRSPWLTSPLRRGRPWLWWVGGTCWTRASQWLLSWHSTERKGRVSSRVVGSDLSLRVSWCQRAIGLVLVTNSQEAQQCLPWRVQRACDTGVRGCMRSRWPLSGYWLEKGEKRFLKSGRDVCF